MESISKLHKELQEANDKLESITSTCNQLDEEIEVITQQNEVSIRDKMYNEEQLTIIYKEVNEPRIELNLKLLDSSRMKVEFSCLQKELDSQFKITVPGFVLPPISTAPVPFGYKSKSLFETVII